MKRNFPRNLSHDAFFKASISIPEAAKDFFMAHLPTWILKKIDLGTLELAQNESVLSNNLRRAADIVYKVNLKANDETIYLLLEHKSSIDYHVLVQHLESQIALMVGSIRGKNKRHAPLIIPITVYNGCKTFPKLSLLSIFSRHARSIARKLFTKGCLFISICDLDDSRIAQHGKAAPMQMLMKYVNQEFNPDTFQQIVLSLFECGLVTANNDYYLGNVFAYFSSGRLSKNVPELLEVINSLHEQLPNALGGKMTSIAQALHDYGYEQGRFKGWKKGKYLGFQCGERLGLRKGEQLGLRKGEQLGLRKGEQLGLRKGEQLGAMRQKMIIAKKMIALSMSSEEIALLTGLDETVIQQLETELITQS